MIYVFRYQSLYPLIKWSVTGYLESKRVLGCSRTKTVGS